MLVLAVLPNSQGQDGGGERNNNTHDVHLLQFALGNQLLNVIFTIWPGLKFFKWPIFSYGMI